MLCMSRVQVYMDAHDHQGLISACIQFGDAKAGGDPQLWADALEYLCARPGGDDCTQQITQVRHMRCVRMWMALAVILCVDSVRSQGAQLLNNSCYIAGCFTQVLAHIEGGAILPPLVVLQTLAKNPSLKVCGACVMSGMQLPFA